MNVKNPRTLTIALTGSIACGKSTLLRAWKKQGAFVLSCDELARAISRRPRVQKQISALLGSTVPAQVAKQVFACPAKRKQLEALLHPLVKKEMLSALKKAKQPIRVVEVPLLFEAGWQDLFDLTVAVLMPSQLQTACAARRGLTKTDLRSRSKAQWTPLQKASRADICVVNNSTVAALQKRAGVCYRALQKFIY